MAAERRWSNGQNGGRANPWRTSPWSPPEPTHERRRSCEQVACACDPNKAKSDIGPQTAANIRTNLAILHIPSLCKNYFSYSPLELFGQSGLGIVQKEYFIQACSFNFSDLFLAKLQFDKRFYVYLSHNMF